MTYANWMRLLAKTSVAVILAITGLLGSGIYAQSTTANILGITSDSTGAVVPDATVTVRNLNTGEVRTAQSSANGSYTFSALQVGTYSVSVNKAGFKTFVAENVTLAAGDKLRIDAALSPGAVTETIQVTDLSPALQTEDSSVGDLVGTKSVADLPLNGRNFVQLIQLTAGVNAGQPTSILSGNRNGDRRQSSAYAANGQSDSYNNNLLDGLDNNEALAGYSTFRPSVEGIDQVKILTSNYSAELGRAAGAVANVITRSGTNSFHGSLFEYLRNDMLDARDYFARSGRKPEYRQNQFGGSVGGPIFKNKTFFFADFDSYRIVRGRTALYTVPTLFEEQNVGNFSDIGGPSSTSGINAIGLEYFQMFPAPNLAGTANNFQGTSKETQNGTTMDFRVDHHFSDKDSLFVRYGYNPVKTLTPSALPTVNIGSVTGIQPGGVLNGVTGNSQVSAHNAQIEYLHLFSPTVLTQFGAGYTLYKVAATPLNYGKNFSQALGIQNANLPNVPGTSGLTLAYAIGYTPLGDGIYIPLIKSGNTYQLNGSVTITHGAHTIKAGGALIERQESQFQPSEAVGGFAFIALPYGFGANPLQSMLKGTAIQVVRTNTLVTPTFIVWEPSGFVQDDWHMLKNLTLNLGARYEILTPISEKHNNLTNFDLPSLTIKVATSSNKRVGVPVSYTNLSPRVGFAYSLPRGTVLRGGFGMAFYNPPGAETNVVGNPPFGFNYAKQGFNNISAGLPIPTLIDPSTFASNSSITTLNGVDPKLRPSYMEQFSLEFQKQLGANVVTIGYVGELGNRLLYSVNADTPPPPGAGNPAPKYVYQTQLPYVTNINMASNTASSSYSALVTQFQRRTSKGLTVNANYTYARGVSDAISPSGANGSTGITGGSIPGTISYDKGNSDTDMRNRFAASITYEIPFGKTSTGLRAAAVKGWQINTIGYWQSGFPFTVINGVTQGPSSYSYANIPGFGSDRPNMLHSAKLSNPSITKAFDTSAFQAQTIGTLGNEHRNQIYGPHDRRMDLSMFKSFPIYREASLQFRAECFNLFNIANFTGPNTSIDHLNADGTPSTTNSNFGTISATAANETPRQLQFALKLNF